MTYWLIPPFRWFFVRGITDKIFGAARLKRLRRIFIVLFVNAGAF